MIRIGGVDKARWLLAVDSLLQVTVKKCVLHVELMDGPGARDGEAEDNPYRGRFDNRTEGLVVVDVVLLGEAADHPAGFVTSQGAVRVEFMFKNPLPRHDVGAWWSWNKAPGAVVDERLVLVRHGSPPVRVSQPTPVVRRDRRYRRVCGRQVHWMNCTKRPCL